MYEPMPTDPRNLSFEQEATDPAEAQAERDYYDGLKRKAKMTPHQKNRTILLKGYNEQRQYIALLEATVAGYEQVLDEIKPNWREICEAQP